MCNLSRISLFLGTLLLVAATSAVGAGPANAASGLRLECNAEGPGDISMQARYEERRARKKFTTEFEAVPGGAFRAGDRMTVVVDAIQVGAIRLKQVVGGDLVGDLNLDTTAGPGDQARPFPRNFPAVQRGTRVAVAINGNNVLGCRLQ
jgi:hypothetical protein